MAVDLRNRTVAPDATNRVPIVPAPGTGVVTASCTERDYRYPVARHVGGMLRIGGEVSLCFDCGPDGGVYHPDDEHSMADVRAVAERIFLHDGDGSVPPTQAELNAFDAEIRRYLDSDIEPCLICGAPVNAKGEGHDEGCMGVSE